jgi:hypothetical protein
MSVFLCRPTPFLAMKKHKKEIVRLNLDGEKIKQWAGVGGPIWF